VTYVFSFGTGLQDVTDVALYRFTWRPLAREMTTHSNKEVAMLKKKLILAATGLALTAPAFADHGHRDYRGHGYGHDRSVVVH